MSALIKALEALSPEAMAGGLIVLDELSRPLTAREIEHALRRHGVDRSRAVIIASSIKRLHIVAVVGPEQ